MDRIHSATYQKRSLLLALRLKDEVLAVVPHRQWVFTIPKRPRVYFRYDRKLLGKLCRAAYETVCDVFKLEIDGDSGVPAMIGAVQTLFEITAGKDSVIAEPIRLEYTGIPVPKNLKISYDTMKQIVSNRPAHFNYIYGKGNLA